MTKSICKHFHQFNRLEKRKCMQRKTNRHTHQVTPKTFINYYYLEGIIPEVFYYLKLWQNYKYIFLSPI